MPVSDSDGDPPGDTDSDGSRSNITRGAILSLLGIGAATWSRLTEFGQDPVGFVKYVVFELIGGFIIDGFGLVADGILIAAFGTDKTPFDLTSIGLLDPPLYLSQLIIGALAPLGASIIETIQGFNQAIAGIGQSAGPFAPVIVPFLWMVEVGAVLGVSWWLIRVIDLPVVNLGPLISGLLSPVRGFMEVLGLR